MREIKETTQIQRRVKGEQIKSVSSSSNTGLNHRNRQEKQAEQHQSSQTTCERNVMLSQLRLFKVKV